MKIWIVFEGTYSDRHTVAVFDNEEAANAYSENNEAWYEHGDTYDIEEWEVDSECKLITDRQVWETWMDRTGTVAGVMSILGPTSNARRCPNSDKEEEPALVYSYWPKLRGVVLHVKRVATGEEHIIKIANEYRAQMIASGEWDRREKEMQDHMEARGQ